MPTDTQWFIYCLNDPHTNEILVEEIDITDICKDQLCEDGKKRNLFRCSHMQIIGFIIAKRAKNLKFEVYIRQGKAGEKGQHGVIRRWKFERGL